MSVAEILQSILCGLVGGVIGTMICLLAIFPFLDGITSLWCRVKCWLRRRHAK